MPFKNKCDFVAWRNKPYVCDCGARMKNKSRYDHNHKYCILPFVYFLIHYYIYIDNHHEFS